MASNPTRRLILLRHAKSAWPEDVPDHERPLAPRGRRAALAAGGWLRKADDAPDRVPCSTARRARETWQLAEQKLGAHRRPFLRTASTGRPVRSRWTWHARDRGGRYVADRRA